MINKVVSTLLLVFLIPAAGFSQDRIPSPHTPVETVFQQIDRAYQQGDLTLNQAMLQKFYVVFDPDKAMSAFLPADGQINTRCLTPLMSEYERYKDEISPGVKAELAPYIQRACGNRSETEFSYITESGRFIIYYDTTETAHSVPPEDTDGNGIPDFVEHTAFAVDSTWNHLFGTLGFADPVIDAATPYEIRYFDLGTNTYGLTCVDPQGPGTFIVMHNNFEDFPENNHPAGNSIGALYATSAHELKHASQYTTNRWEGDAGSFAWTEMDATMIEDIIFGDVNDNLQFLRANDDPAVPGFSSIFGNPGSPIPVAYDHFTWKLYFSEKIGMEFWVDVWEQFKDEPEKEFIKAMRESLNRYDSTFEKEHIENISWHFASGPEYSGADFGFKRRDLYPNPTFNWIFDFLPDSTSIATALRPLAGNFIIVRPDGFESGNARITANFDREGVDIALLGFFSDGRVDFLKKAGTGTRSVLETRWLWEDLQKLGVVLINREEPEGESIRYTLQAESVIPEEITLFQNYPNPFNPATNIQFYVNRSQGVRIDIFDILGRHVRTLTDRDYLQGHHNLSFEARDLASGVYIYRLTAGNQRASKKMMLIK